MTLWTLIRRGLRFHAGTHFGVFLGVTVGTAALTGALLIGDSVRGSLREQALSRLAGASFALDGRDRFFGQDLRERLNSAVAARGSDSASSRGNSILRLPAVIVRQDGSARANQTQLLGVEDAYFGRPLGRGEVWLNQTLAAQLRAHAGDEVIVRVQKPSFLSRDAAVSPKSQVALALHLKIAGIAPDARANLSLFAGPAPGNAFMRLDELSADVDRKGRANLLLLRDEDGPSISALEPRLSVSWRLSDAEASLTVSSNRQVLELRSQRVFLDPALGRAALAADSNAVPLLTFLANLIKSGTNETPYSMVTGAGPPYTAADQQDDEITLSRWLAEDLKAVPGAYVDVAAFDPESGSALRERTNRFRVRAVVEMQAPWADRTLMPDFPGIENAESTRDWDAGFPLAYHIRPADETYWKQHRGTPKAFITLRAAQRLWANRFGDLTAVRFPVGASLDAKDRATALEAQIRASVRPAELGLQFTAVREEALRGVEQSQDFGQLFLGFSFFLITAALLLMAMLFQFGLEQRATEVGVLLALGFPPVRVRRIFLGEGLALALVGGVTGSIAGLGYAASMLWGLSTIWREAVGGSRLRLHVGAATLPFGVALGALLAVGVLWLALRRQAQLPARVLLAGGSGSQSIPKKSRGFCVGMGAAVAGVGTLVYACAAGKTADAEAFFSAGTFLLIAGLAWAGAWFASLADTASNSVLSLPSLGVRGCVRRRARSLSTVALLACGAFLILSIGVFRLDATRDARKRTSGTGGFTWIGESTLPWTEDPVTASGREGLGLSGDFSAVTMVPIRVRRGDDASCLNLSRAQHPRLLGVRPQEFSGRFTFTEVAKGLDRRAGWSLLQTPLPDGEVAAVGDANSIQWALGKAVGETIDYPDEQGRIFKVRLVGAVANSILQGNLVIDEASFVRRYPTESGYRMLLVETPSNAVDRVASELTRAMQDAGLELSGAARRLNEFNAVQNTYLGTFQVLGGLGLLLGSAGLGVVVLRNVRERRAELAAMMAVGFRARELRRLVLSEHAVLLALGLGIGLLSAVAAVWPAVSAPGRPLPYGSLALTLAAVWVSGMIWTWLALRRALRGDLLAALRNE